MTAGLRFLLGSTVLLLVTGVAAGPRDYLIRNQRICDAENVFCMRGTLTYDSNPRLLHLRARVQTAPGPGMLRVRLAGANELGHQRRAPFEVRVRGKYSEIIDHKMIPDHPDVYEWTIERVEFIAESKSGKAYAPR